MSREKNKPQAILLWVVAFLVTAASAAYQRRTGPTYPVEGSIHLGVGEVEYRLLRSETVGRDAQVNLTIPDTTVSGSIRYRRYKSNDEWTDIELIRSGDALVGEMPHQPAAGKIMYFVHLKKDEVAVSLTGDEPVILRYKGEVPAAILIPHILIMFATMLLSTRAGLEAVTGRDRTRRLTLWTIGLLFLGGFILGPLMQKYAFGAFWTGVPFGWDLTDNKTLIVMLAWLWVWFKSQKGSGRGWIVFASVLTLIVYLIPHSLLGSELDYTKMPTQQ